MAVPPPATTAEAERKLLRQRQAIEALISQNDALTAELLALKSGGSQETNRAPVAAPFSEPPRPAAPPPVTVPDSTPLLSANADGVIDTVALQVPAQGTPVNPFAVRTNAAAAREVTLTLQGIVTGATPCALVNGRLLRPGDVLESLQLERVEAEAVFLRGDGFRLKLSPGEKPVRVRLPL